MIKLKDLVPSMFHRRLLLISGVLLVVVAALILQAGRLTLVRGGALLEVAESRLVTERWTPTVRGRIFDRKGRVLALDEASFDVLVDFRVITEAWAEDQARRHARREFAQEWERAADLGRLELIERCLPEYLNRLDAMWDELAAVLGMDRAEIDRRRWAITGRISPMAALVREKQRRSREAELNVGRSRPIQLSLAEVSNPIREERLPHVLVRGVDESVSYRLRRMAALPEQYPGLEIRPSGRRSYPLETVVVPLVKDGLPRPILGDGGGTIEVRVDGVATQLIGWMRGVQAEDYQRRPTRAGDGTADRGAYREGDLVGAEGIEGGWEDVLRGVRGRVIRHLNSGEESVIPPTPGRDVQLTLDAQLQARIQALMDPEVGLAKLQRWHLSTREDQHPDMPLGTPLNGAAVVLAVDTGEILAMVSTPSFTRSEFQERSRELWEDLVNRPLVNKAMNKPYPPGSIVKPMILNAAVASGVHRLSDEIVCTGHLFPNNTEAFRCWLYKQYRRTHADDFGGGIGGARAIEVSCNVYFYTLGQKLGVQRTVDWYRRFGVGQLFRLGAGEEFAGTVGQKWGSSEPLQIQDAIFMGMGQGPVVWTPLHAASAYATLAMEGVRMPPRLVRGMWHDGAPRPIDLDLNWNAVDEAEKGLIAAVSGDYGTGRWLYFSDGSREPIFNAPGVTVWGKTGTAEAPPILGEDPDGPGPLRAPILRSGDHSWFVVLVGPEGGRPRYAVSVIMEYAGSGGRVSGPIANQIIRALQSEGYL